MYTVLHFLLLAALLMIVVRTFGAYWPYKEHVFGRMRSRNEVGSDSLGLRWIPPVKDVDPVCEETIITEKAKPSVYAGMVYYFCSRECREIFEVAPDLYVGHSQRNANQLTHSREWSGSQALREREHHADS